MRNFHHSNRLWHWIEKVPILSLSFKFTTKKIVNSNFALLLSRLVCLESTQAVNKYGAKITKYTYKCIIFLVVFFSLEIAHKKELKSKNHVLCGYAECFFFETHSIVATYKLYNVPIYLLCVIFFGFGSVKWDERRDRTVQINEITLKYFSRVPREREKYIRKTKIIRQDKMEITQRSTSIADMSKEMAIKTQNDRIKKFTMINCFISIGSVSSMWPCLLRCWIPICTVYCLTIFFFLRKAYFNI